MITEKRKLSFPFFATRLVCTPENMVSLAAAGAGSLASITSVVPLGDLMTMKWPPPSPEAAGLIMP